MESKDLPEPTTFWMFEKINITVLSKLIQIPSEEIIGIWALFIIELPVVCTAIYGLYFLIKTDHVVPVVVINLLISDLLQICFRPLMYLFDLDMERLVAFWLYSVAMMANVGFMVCICLERGIMITFPVWYRFHHSVKCSVYICLFIWAFSASTIGLSQAMATEGNLESAFLISAILLLLPYPLAIFSFVGSWRALARSVSVPPDEQKRILTILGLVLFNYTVMFLPGITCNILFYVSLVNGQADFMHSLRAVAGMLMYLNPLVDCLLYVFLRKNSRNILRCFCDKIPSRNRNQSANSTINRNDAESDI